MKSFCHDYLPTPQRTINTQRNRTVNILHRLFTFVIRPGSCLENWGRTLNNIQPVLRNIHFLQQTSKMVLFELSARNKDFP